MNDKDEISPGRTGSRDAACSPALAGLIERLENAAKNKEMSWAHDDSDYRRGQIDGAASAFLQAASMASQCMENAEVRHGAKDADLD